MHKIVIIIFGVAKCKCEAFLSLLDPEPQDQSRKEQSLLLWWFGVDNVIFKVFQ